MSRDSLWYQQELASLDHDRQVAAAMQIAQAQSPPAEVAVALLQALRSADDELLEAVTAALEGLGKPADSQLDALAKLVNDPQLDVAYWAVTLLGRSSQATHCVVSAFLIGLEHPELAVRERAVWAIGQTLPQDPRLEAALRKVVLEPQPRLSRMATETLERLASQAR